MLQLLSGKEVIGQYLSVPFSLVFKNVFHFTLPTLHSSLYTLHSALYTLQSTLYTPHPTLYTLHATLCSLYCTTLHTLHFTSRSALYTSRPPHSAFYTFQFNTPNSTFHTLSTSHTFHFTLYTSHFTLYLHTLHATFPHNTSLSLHSGLCALPHSAFHSLKCIGTLTGKMYKRVFKQSVCTKVLYVTAFGPVGCILIFFGNEPLLP